MAAPITVSAATAPPKPAGGGHYVKIAPGQFRLIHAIGPRKWAPGPPTAKGATGGGTGGGTVGPGISVNNPLLQPGMLLTGKDLYNTAKAAVDAQISPSIKAINQAIAQNQQQTKGAVNLTGGYFNQLGALSQNAADRANQIGTNLNTTLGNIATDENTALAGLGQNAQDMLAKYTPQGGATSSSLAAPGVSSLASEIARQQGLAAQSEGAQRAFGATQGANLSGLAASQIGTGALRGQQDLYQIAQAGQLKNAPLTQKIAQLQGQRGALLTSTLGKLRQQEIANQYTAQGLGIKQQSATTAANTAAFNQNPNAPGSTAQNRVAGQKVASGRLTQQQRQNDPNVVGSAAWARIQNSQGDQWSRNVNAVGSPAWARVQTNNARSSPGGTSKPLTTLENNHFWGTIGQIEQFVRDGQQNGQSEAQIRAALGNGTNVAKRSFDPFLVGVAYQLLRGNGMITQQQAATLHNQYGVRGGTYNGQPIRVQNSLSAPVSGIGNTVAGTVTGALGGFGAP